MKSKLNRTFAAAGLVGLLVSGGLAFNGCGDAASSTKCGLSSNLCSCVEVGADDKTSCLDFENYTVESAKSTCKGTFSTTAACSTANRVGSCRVGLSIGEDRYYRRYYTTDYADVVAGAAACQVIKVSMILLASVDWIAD